MQIPFCIDIKSEDREQQFIEGQRQVPGNTQGRFRYLGGVIIPLTVYARHQVDIEKSVCKEQSNS